MRAVYLIINNRPAAFSAERAMSLGFTADADFYSAIRDFGRGQAAAA
jgi:hypothetical protein